VNYPNNTQAQTQYRGGFQYDNQTLQFIQTPEGYVRHTVNPFATSSFGDFDYVYNYTDHLGNIRLSYVLDPATEELKVMEENHYYPFGLKHSYNLNIRTIGYRDETLEGGAILDPSQDYRKTIMVNNNGYQYKYNGKELEEELGKNTYAYGWRDYDPAIGRFVKIDRFAEKYHHKSPFDYAANNPIYFIDVAGDSLYVTHRKGFLGLGGKETLKYENGNLLNRDGSAYSGKVKGFLKKAVDALGNLSQSQEGSDIINELQNSANNFTIIKSSDDHGFKANDSAKGAANIPELQGQIPSNVSRNGSGGTILFAPNNSLSGTDTNGNNSVSPFIMLGHEMAHGKDANRGMLYPGDILGSYNPSHNGLLKREWRAVYYENIVRGQLGLPLRAYYKLNFNLDNSTFSSSGPRLLDSQNNPINYP
jgi:RHS repeat-associated protein